MLPDKSFPVASTIVVVPEARAVDVRVLVKRPEPVPEAVPEAVSAEIEVALAMEPTEDALARASNKTSAGDEIKDHGIKPTRAELSTGVYDLFLVGIGRAGFVGAVVDAIAKLHIFT